MQVKVEVLCDTNIISSYFSEKNKDINKILDKDIGIENICITPVIYIEVINWLSLYKGFSKQERKTIKDFVNKLKVIHLNKSIGDLSMEIALKLDNSQPQDTLIGATAISKKMPLYTLNQKDFQRMQEKFGLKLYN